MICARPLSRGKTLSEERQGDVLESAGILPAVSQELPEPAGKGAFMNSLIH